MTDGLKIRTVDVLYENENLEDGYISQVCAFDTEHSLLSDSDNQVCKRNDLKDYIDLTDFLDTQMKKEKCEIGGYLVRVVDSIEFFRRKEVC